jgi:hypothetical protein
MSRNIIFVLIMLVTLHVTPKRQVISELHGVTTRKTVIFIVLAVRTSNPSFTWYLLQNAKSSFVITWLRLTDTHPDTYTMKHNWPKELET